MSVTVALVLAGCASGGSTSDDSTEKPLRVAGADPENMIPGNSYAFYLQQLMFDPLMQIDPESGEVIPLVAESVQTEDQQTWTVTLHDDWTFHNGDPVTAQNYADAWNSTAFGPNAWVNNSYFTIFEGYEALNPAEGEPTAEELSGVEVLSDTELQIALTAPNGLFPYTLANPALGPLPEVAFEDFAAFNSAPVGNGAFQIDGTYAPAATYSVVAYDGYAGIEPRIGAIDMIPYTDYSTAFNDLLAGNLDTVYPVPGQRLTEMEANLPNNFARSTIPNLNYFAMPMWDERFEDVRVRQAISMAIDRQALVDTILAGAAAPATSMAPESAVGARGDSCEACVFDPEGAKALLEEAGGFDGQLVLFGTQYTFEDQVLQAVANQLSQNLGIDATFRLDPESYANFEAQEIDGPTLAYWGAYFPHIQAMVEPFYSSSGAANITGYQNAEFDALLSEGNGLSGDEAIQRYQQAEDMALSEMYVLPLYFGIYTAAWGHDIESVPTGPNGYGNLGQTIRSD